MLVSFLCCGKLSVIKSVVAFGFTVFRQRVWCLSLNMFCGNKQFQSIRLISLASGSKFKVWCVVVVVFFNSTVQFTQTFIYLVSFVPAVTAYNKPIKRTKKSWLPFVPHYFSQPFLASYWGVRFPHEFEPFNG